MFKWRRFKHIEPLEEQLARFANEARTKASVLPTTAERSDLLRRARLADTTAHLDEWANSPGLQPPT
jgi:hypothetical protein